MSMIPRSGRAALRAVVCVSCCMSEVEVFPVQDGFDDIEQRYQQCQSSSASIIEKVHTLSVGESVILFDSLKAIQIVNLASQQLLSASCLHLNTAPYWKHKSGFSWRCDHVLVRCPEPFQIAADHTPRSHEAVAGICLLNRHSRLYTHHRAPGLSRDPSTRRSITEGPEMLGLIVAGYR